MQTEMILLSCFMLQKKVSQNVAQKYATVAW